MKTMKKHPVSKTNGALAPVGGADPLPSQKTPVPPRAPLGHAARGARSVRVEEVRCAPVAAVELERSARYAAALGSSVPPADVLAGALEFSAGWSQERAAAEAWVEYVRAQADLAWGHTLDLLEKTRAVFEPVAAHDPTVVAELPTFAALLGARAKSAKLAASRRRAKSAQPGATPVAPPAK